MVIPLPGQMNTTNITSIFDFANYAQQSTNGWFWLIILIASGVISMSWLNQFGWRGNTASLFFVLALTTLFRFLGFIGDFMLILIIVILAIMMFLLYIIDE